MHELGFEFSQVKIYRSFLPRLAEHNIRIFRALFARTILNSTCRTKNYSLNHKNASINIQLIQKVPLNASINSLQEFFVGLFSQKVNRLLQSYRKHLQNAVDEMQAVAITIRNPRAVSYNVRENPRSILIFLPASCC